MPYPASEYTQFWFPTDPTNPRKWVKCLRATAAFYGWSQVGAPDPEAEPVPGHPGWRMRPYVVADGPHIGGKRLRICRKASTNGWGQGMTNCFRISRNVTEADLAWLAKNTAVPFGWMETRSYQRRSSADWLAIANSIGV